MATVVEIKAVLRKLGLPLSGNKADLVARLPYGVTPKEMGELLIQDAMEMDNEVVIHPSGTIVTGYPAKVYPKNPRTAAAAMQAQQERDAHRVARGVPLGLPIGSLYDTGEVDDDGQPIIARIYAEDALPRLSVTVKRAAPRQLPPITCIPCGSRDDTCTCDDTQLKAGEQE